MDSAVFRRLPVCTGILVLLVICQPAAAQSEEEPDLTLMSFKELNALKAKYTRKRARHAKRLPALRKQLERGNQLLAQELYPLQAKFQKELEAVEKFDERIKEIEAEVSMRKQPVPDLKQKKLEARKRVTEQRQKDEAARHATRARREAEERSYRSKLELLDAELDRRDQGEEDQRRQSKRNRRMLLVGMAVGLVLLAGGVIVFLKLRNR